MSAAEIAYIADNRVHLLYADGSTETIDSPFVADAHRRDASIARRIEWKTQGTGARFAGAAALWDDGAGRQAPSTVTSLSRGRRRGELLYAISVGPVSALLAYDVAAREEQRILHGTEGALLSLATSEEHYVIAMSRAQKNGARNIAVMRDDGEESSLVTDGDTFDDNPTWVPAGRDAKEGRFQLVYQSTGLARDASGYVAGLGPTEVMLLDAESGALKTLLADPGHDYFSPRMTRDGTLYAIRRPYGAKDSPGFGEVVKDGLLAPARLAYAGFRYLDFFTQRYTGKPLSTLGDTKARNVDARRLLERENIAAAEPGAPTPSFKAPSDWVLVKRAPGDGDRIITVGALAYDLALDGTLYVSDGEGIDRIDPDGDERTAARVPGATSLTVVL